MGKIQFDFIFRTFGPGNGGKSFNIPGIRNIAHCKIIDYQGSVRSKSRKHKCRAPSASVLSVSAVPKSSQTFLAPSTSLSGALPLSIDERKSATRASLYLSRNVATASSEAFERFPLRKSKSMRTFPALLQETDRTNREIRTAVNFCMAMNCRLVLYKGKHFFRQRYLLIFAVN